MEYNRVIYERPYDAEVEYLESTGTQYIDTGVLFDINKSISCDIRAAVLSEGKNFGCLLGAESDANMWNYRIYVERSNKQIGLKQQPGYFTRFSSFDSFFDISVPKNMNKISFNNTDYTINNWTDKGIATNSNLALFALRRGRGVADLSYLKIASAKIYKQDVLVRDFIPVRVGSVGYMYDKVSGKLFANKGTGNFILGNDVVNPVPNIRRVFRFGNKRFVMPII